MLRGQDGLHLHHPGSHKHVVGLHIPEEKRQRKPSDATHCGVRLSRLIFGPTDFVSACALCWRYVSLCALIVWRLFLSISLAAAGTLARRKASGNQMMFAVRVIAGTCRRRQTQTPQTVSDD